MTLKRLNLVVNHVNSIAPATNTNKKRYNACIEQLDQIDPSGLSDNLKAEIAFFKMAASAHSSFGGGSMTATDAAQFAASFLNQYPNNWHYFEACRIMADLAMEAGRFDSAADYYGKAIQSGWPTVTGPANQKLGEAYIRLEQYEQAKKVSMPQLPPIQ